MTAMILTTRSALKVQKPYISHEITDSPFTRASFDTEALVSQNGLHEVLNSLTSMEEYLLPGFYRASFMELKKKFLVLDIMQLRLARHTYRKLFVNLAVSRFLNVFNLLSVSRASSKEFKRKLCIIGSVQWCF